MPPPSTITIILEIIAARALKPDLATLKAKSLIMPPPLPVSFSPQRRHRTACPSHLQVSREKELRANWVYFLLEILPLVPDGLPFLLTKPQEYEKPSNFPFHLGNSSDNLSHTCAAASGFKSSLANGKDSK